MRYYEQLNDEKWQEKRREILERDDFQCVKCENKTRPEVHHGYYDPWTMLWEYEDNTMHTLCRECHDQTHKLLSAVHRYIAEVSPKGLEAFLEKIPDLAFDIYADIQCSENYEIINPYHEYFVTITLDTGFNDKMVRDAAKKAADAFRGVTIEYSLSEVTGAPHGAVIVFGPDDEVADKIQQWIENHSGHN